ncbi:unnamed protein product [Caenorhabditis angaria]|uniref:Carboxylesterase type B domain-containing protein n=1 Tax=Caenorhabditis angaria TaxID=860376 RepID=A0A9P1IV60_9PELO|nr:unnamed protein product [Caenorhabditis angaria]
MYILLIFLLFLYPKLIYPAQLRAQIGLGSIEGRFWNISLNPFADPSEKPENRRVPVSSAIVFLGIPFLEPPVGELRFEEPRVLRRSWRGVRATKEFSKACWAKKYEVPVARSEDCLYMNVFTNEYCMKKKNCHVMVIVHYGQMYRFSPQAVRHDVIIQEYVAANIIVVIPPFRMGIFGFPNFGANRNLGLLDLIEGFKWVQREIGNFGGDRGKVTAHGYSSGALLIAILSTLPETRGLYGRQEDTYYNEQYLPNRPFIDGKLVRGSVAEMIARKDFAKRHTFIGAVRQEFYTTLDCEDRDGNAILGSLRQTCRLLALEYGYQTQAIQKCVDFYSRKNYAKMLTDDFLSFIPILEFANANYSPENRSHVYLYSYSYSNLKILDEDFVPRPSHGHDSTFLYARTRAKFENVTRDTVVARAYNGFARDFVKSRSPWLPYEPQKMRFFEFKSENFAENSMRERFHGEAWEFWRSLDKFRKKSEISRHSESFDMNILHFYGYFKTKLIYQSFKDKSAPAIKILLAETENHLESQKPSRFPVFLILLAVFFVFLYNSMREMIF